MDWMMTLLKIVPFVVKLIGTAEKAFSDVPKSGETKKALVMDAAETIVDTMETVSTGGQKETWQKLSEPISELVDASCDMLFSDKTDVPEV